MFRTMAKSKIHGCTITKTMLNYSGSLGIDESLMEAADILEGERVQVVNLANGERLETYVITESKDSGTICLYGPAAYKGKIGDKIHIISYAIVPEEKCRSFKIRKVAVDEKNRLH